ncbi:TniB family NTP-binding protein [Pseudomonas sp. GV071]|uniref:TniB family NTP-binding protein n=1 Tax=Pseudomonas sp. GV071 TaxID=2135754 RepID=UPI000D42E2B3|nr:TniB family NTP-binding protein [Pseudomonas sp. GV071]PTQ66761.1 TniB protein [Pseudomonas sp. GV071]
MSDSDKYAHVVPSRRIIVEAEDAIRIQAINEDIWVEYPQAAKILAYVRYMMRLPDKHQSPCLLISSAGGMGKSSIYQRIVKLHGSGGNNNEEILASMTIRARHATGHKVFSDDLVGALTGNIYRSGKTEDGRIAAALSARNVRGIVLDEVNDMLHANRSDQAKNMKLLKELSGSPYHLIVIGLGTEDCHDAIDSDAQFSRRFTKIELARWQDEQGVRSFVESYAMTFPLKSPSKLGKPAIVRHLIKESDGVLDAIVKILCNAASWAVLEGREEIDLELIKKGRDMPFSE